MDIVVCTDINYIMPCGIMMTSLCENNKDELITFHFIINDTVTPPFKEQLTKIAKFYSKEIEFITMDDNELKGLPIPLKRYTASVYYRMFLAKILPLDIHKVLFLDGDIIIRRSLIPLWETDISDVAIGAIPDMGDANMEFYNRLQYDSSKGYFNGGVLLINLDYWRTHDVLERLLDYLAKYPSRIVLNDQDVMNVVLQDEKRNLPLKFNMQEGYLYSHNSNFEWGKYGDELNEALTTPTIIHYTHKIKPWYKECPHPYKDEYLKYKEMTIWKTVPLSSYQDITHYNWLKKLKYCINKMRHIPIYSPEYIDVRLNTNELTLSSV